MAAPRTVVLTAGVGEIAADTLTTCDMALEVTLTICAIVEEVNVVLLLMPFIPGSMMVICIVAISTFIPLKWREFSNSQQFP